MTTTEKSKVKVTRLEAGWYQLTTNGLTIEIMHAGPACWNAINEETDYASGYNTKAEAVDGAINFAMNRRYDERWGWVV